MQWIINKCTHASKVFGLAINIKTEFVHQPICNHLPALDHTGYAEGKVLKTVSAFTYLGSIVSKDAKTDKEIACRIGKVSSDFGNLYHRLWYTREGLLKVKIEVYMSVVLTSLLHLGLCTDDTSMNFMPFTCVAYYFY